MTIGNVSPGPFQPAGVGGYAHGGAGPASAHTQSTLRQNEAKRTLAPYPHKSSRAQQLRRSYSEYSIFSTRQSSFVRNKATLAKSPTHAKLLSHKDQELFEFNLAVVNSLLPDCHGEMDCDAFAILEKAANKLAELNSQCEAILFQFVDSAARISAASPSDVHNDIADGQYDNINGFSCALLDIVQAVTPAKPPGPYSTVSGSEASISGKQDTYPDVTEAAAGPSDAHTDVRSESSNASIARWVDDVAKDAREFAAASYLNADSIFPESFKTASNFASSFPGSHQNNGATYPNVTQAAAGSMAAHQRGSSQSTNEMTDFLNLLATKASQFTASAFGKAGQPFPESLGVLSNYATPVPNINPANAASSTDNASIDPTENEKEQASTVATSINTSSDDESERIDFLASSNIPVYPDTESQPRHATTRSDTTQGKAHDIGPDKDFRDELRRRRANLSALENDADASSSNNVSTQRQARSENRNNLTGIEQENKNKSRSWRNLLQRALFSPNASTGTKRK